MNDKIEEVVSHPLFIPAAVGLASFASGLGLGFFLGKRKAETITQFVVHEVDTVTLDASDDSETEVQTEAPTPVVIDEEVAKEKGIIKVNSLADLTKSMVVPDAEPDEEVIINVESVTVEEDMVIVPATGPPEDEEVPEAEDGIPWDWDAELAKRLSTEPYILHLEEFEADELGFTKYSLTFYSQDEVLVDENTVPIFNHSSTVGDLLFGHGSGQVDVVYIRNHERKAEYEITRLDQSFAMEIHGLEAENNERIKDLRHGKVLKFRDN